MYVSMAVYCTLPGTGCKGGGVGVIGWKKERPAGSACGAVKTCFCGTIAVFLGVGRREPAGLATAET